MCAQLIFTGKSSTLALEATMQDRRKEPRTDLMSYSQVFDLNNGKLIGYLGDINHLGAMVIGDEARKVDDHLHISIQLPELPGVRASRMVLPVRVAYCQQDLSPEYFNIGLEFEIVTNQQKEVIESIMQNYEFKRQTPNYPEHPE
jgi:hypothetical protein